jgi:SIR2-like domain
MGTRRVLFGSLHGVKLRRVTEEKEDQQSGSEGIDDSANSPDSAGEANGSTEPRTAVDGPAEPPAAATAAPSSSGESDADVPRVRFAGLTDWQALRAPSDADDETQHLVEETQSSLDERLLSILSAERLVVLAGLGTSRELDNAVDMADLWREAENIPGFEEAAALSPDGRQAEDIEVLLSRCQSKLDLEEDQTLREFVRSTERRILDLCSFIDDQTELPTHGQFLRRIARRSTRLPRVEIFTTNYDLAFERAAADTRFFLVDGFQLRPPYRFDGNALDVDLVHRQVGEGLMLEPNVAQLLKLHGSVDWNRASGSVQRVTGRPDNPALIYPRQSKFQHSFAPPYLEFMARFQMALRARDVAVLIIGFGLRDEHLVQPLRLAVESNIGLRLVVVSPNLSNNGDDPIKSWVALTENGDRRLTLIKSTFAKFADLLPDVAPYDERELHDRRIEGNDVIGA